tara:strand:+ start:585 stop:869 length:285 start_codon:yes stop_codon:yes gene_type:complete
MEKIEYKVGSKKKELTIIELGWQDFCKSTDLAIKISNPNGSQFTDIANLVMLYTGKKDQDMMEWKNSCKTQADFVNEVSEAFLAITKHIESKKK